MIDQMDEEKRIQTEELLIKQAPRMQKEEIAFQLKQKKKLDESMKIGQKSILADSRNEHSQSVPPSLKKELN